MVVSPRSPERLALRSARAPLRRATCLKVTPPTRLALQKPLLAREVGGDRGFSREQADAGEQQVPPQALTLLGFFPRHLLRLLGLDVHRRGMAGDRGDQLARVDRVQV